MEALLRRVGVDIVLVGAPIAQLAAISLHCYATYLALTVGWDAAIATFALPLVSEAYWFTVLAREAGWVNQFALIAYGVIGSMLFVGLGLCLLDVADLLAVRARGRRRPFRGTFADAALGSNVAPPGGRARY